MRFGRPFPKAVAAGLLAAAFAACSNEPSAPRAPVNGPAPLILDGANGSGGNPNFFFLPPLVPNPSGDPDFNSGQFVATWRPVVAVCRLDASNVASGCQTGSLRTWQGAEVTVSASEEAYTAKWDTKEAWATPGTYRLSVSLVGTTGSKALGYADIALLASMSEAKNIRTGDIIPMNDGRTLPIKFRIEKGASVTNTTDYAEQVVTSSGGTVTSSTGGGGFQAASGWLPAGITSTTVTIERVESPAPGTCGASYPGLISLDPCYRVTTYPAVGVVQASVVIGVCPSLSPNDPRYEAQVGFKFDAPSRLKELQNVVAPFMNCGGFSSTTRRPASGAFGRLRDGLQWVASGLGSLVSPKEAWAIDAGYGFALEPGVDDLSDFFWGIPIRVDVFGGDAQSGPPGLALESAVQVRVTGTHVHPGEPATAIAGVPVTFSPAAGSVAATTVTTNADGVASTAWTLGSAIGTQTLTARVPGVGPATPDTIVTFSATSRPPVNGLGLLVSGAPVAGNLPVDGVSLADGQTRTYIAGPTYNETPVSATCTWQIADPAIATVAYSGTGMQADITSVGVGTTGLTLTCDGYSHGFFVDVNGVRLIDPVTRGLPQTSIPAGTTAKWKYELFNIEGPCQISPATGNSTLYAYGSSDANGNYINIAGRSAGTMDVGITCGNSSKSYSVTVTPLPAGIAASCVNGASYGGDFIDRGFYIPSYPAATIAGADLRFSAATPGTYTIGLHARTNGFQAQDGALLAQGTATVQLSGDINDFVDAHFSWPAEQLAPGTLLAFDMVVISGPESAQLPYYAVPSTGDQACPIVQTNGTTTTNDFRRLGIFGKLYSATP